MCQSKPVSRRRTWRKACTAAACLGVWAGILTTLTGCDDQPPATASNMARPRRVVTTFTILQDMAQNVAGDKAIVESITKPGAEIHESEPTPLDIVKAQSADLVLRNGMGLERWFEKFMSSIRAVPSVDLSDGIEPIGIGEGPYNGKPNPHSWMSPKNALIYVENIRKALTEMDPANAPAYSANAAAYAEKIKAIDEPLRAKLSEIPRERRWLVTSEGAFSSLIRDYQMKELFLWPVNADEEGTPRQIQKVMDTVRQHKIPVCFSESTISDKPMRQVCRETGARYGGLLYVDSLTGEDGEAPTYLLMLTHNADTIVEGFREPK
ncbi:MAG: metal ABC transporter substrate-binding protein [Phycisphaeraceae bacterium]|nr:metal ABC transporter substrate-binding protein [Phycisphaeraceae bacterium]